MHVLIRDDSPEPAVSLLQSELCCAQLRRTAALTMDMIDQTAILVRQGQAVLEQHQQRRHSDDQGSNA